MRYVWIDHGMLVSMELAVAHPKWATSTLIGCHGALHKSVVTDLSQAAPRGCIEPHP